MKRLRRHLHNAGGLYIMLGGVMLVAFLVPVLGINRHVAGVIYMLFVVAGCVYGQTMTYWPPDNGGAT